MPVLDGDGNAVPGATTNTTTNNSGNGSLAINTSKNKQGYGTITPQYIVIHNTAGGTASSNADWFCNGAGGSGNCTQFITDDKEIYQIMPPTQKARHIQGSNTNGGKGCSAWSSTLAPAMQQCGATNSNSIGIEVADGYNPNTNTFDSSKVDMAKAVELTIELTRYLMTQYNIPIENVVRHGDTHNKDCPMRIMQLNLWPYFKEQCQKRNQENRPVSFNPTTLNTSGQPAAGGSGYTVTQLSTGGGTGTELYASPTDIEVQLPDVDHRENTTNMDEVKGVTIVFYPPYHSCEAYEAEEHFKLFNWDRTYHYTIGRTNPNVPEEEETTPEEGETTPEEDISLFNTRSTSKYRAYIYNVDDGLCVFIKNGDTNILIDCGEEGKAVKADAINHIKSLGVNKINHVILTHFHSDHVAGFKDFANNFEIENVYYKDLKKSLLPQKEIDWGTDKYYDEVLQICRDKQINETKITADETVSCVKIFVGDTSDNYSDYNGQSLSMTVTMNGKKLFVAGDIIYATEKIILPKLEKCDAMIIGHHGYATSNGQDLLDKIDADTYFVTTYITDDDDHKEVIERINNVNTEFYSTHNNGSKILLDFNSYEITHDAKTKVNGDTSDDEGGDEGEEGGDEGGDEGGEEIIEGDPVGGPKVLETASGFEIYQHIEEARQSKGFTDNDTHTYIDRALFNNKREKHNITVALMCPENPDDYPAYEKAYIEGISIILHEHGLGINDLWREFDLNRAPSPFLYLNTGDNNNFAPYAWQDFLSEVEKQLDWRILKYGSYSKQYVPYTAGSSGLSGGSTGSIGGGNLSGGTTTTPGTPITGDTEMQSDNEVANTCYATFISLGFTPEAACAVIGNIQQESGLRPTVVNSSSGATGLCQWLGGRLSGLKSYAASKGTQWTDVATQCEWAWEECKGKDSTTKSLLDKNCGGPDSYKVLTDISRAVDLWRKCFERCGEHEANDAKRLSYAQNWYSQIVQKGGGTTPSPDSGGSSGGTGTLPPLEEASLEPVLFSTRITPRSNYIAYVGDSLTVGMGKAVPSIKTYATIGHTVGQGYDKYASQIVADKPLVVIMSYGTNDSLGETTKFVTDYKKFINYLKDNIPNVQIYINKILPGDASKSGCTSNYKKAIKNIPTFNEKLIEISLATQTDLINATSIGTSANYSNDGLHLNTEGYKAWHQEIQKQINSMGGSTGDENTSGGESASVVFGWPLPGIDKVSSKFGPRKPPCAGASSMHGGIDIGAASGTPIKAYAAGTIVQNVAWNKSAGNYIKIDHGNGVASRYLHMVEPSPLAVGTVVTAGQEVGKVGNSGVGTGAHLHFEIHIDGEKVDPLLYVTPGGGSTGKMTQLGDGAGGVTGTPTIGGGGNWGQIGAPSDGLLYDDQQQNKTDATIDGNSAGGEQHQDWGGKMIYKKGEPSDPNAVQPEIATIITKEMYTDIIQYSDPAIIDDYVMDFEPYSKGLASVDDNMITMNDRINAMTKTFTTSNENKFHYKVIESGPGSKDHCVTIAEELNYIAIPQDLKVEPIYPDLVIPPGYTSTDADISSPNSIPIATVKEAGTRSSDAFTKQLSFDYDVLEGKIKSSNKLHHPINYTDPYPYDEKITDLERHYPKVFIDEIEGQLYSCNHPGCPISQPMAKNFAMVSDALMNQSKRTEQRLSRIENILSTIIRNQGRLGARMNINCVYYGGHSTFNKYKCIRCLHDDRVHDGELVTIDQCLNCTRFEPILGQIYNILDDSGLNGSIILDDMQMSYTDLEGFRNLNDITHRSSKYFNALATEEANCKKPEKKLSDMWKEADKEQAIAQIKSEVSDATEAQTKIDALKEEDYIFKMDWSETFFNAQEPDTKPYPNEGIVARQKAKDLEGDGPDTLEDMIAELDPERDAAAIEELQERIKIRDGIWVDTREKADSVQVNKYTSENFFFEDFNKVRIGKYGIRFNSLYGYNGEDYNNVYSGPSGVQLLGGQNGSSVFASQARDKIVEMAKQILKDGQDGKAWYSQEYRTTEYDKPVTIKAGNGTGKIGYDCTSFVSCCYMNAGLKSMYSKTCSGGTLIKEIQKGGKMIPCNKDNMQYILPGDILITASGTVTQNDCNQLKFFSSSHAAIYVGNNQIIHARGKNYGIQATDMDYYLSKSNYVFVRPADLLATDLAASQQSSSSSSGSVTEESGTINGQNYIAKIPGAVCSCYKGLASEGGNLGVDGKPLVMNVSCASHNIPYGTKVYVPGLAGKVGTGILVVQDTGGPLFDFDICTNNWSGKDNFDVYVLEWGDTSKIAKSYTWAIDLYVKNGSWNKYIKAWNTYKNMNGKLINYHKFNQEDATITNHPNYNDK